MRAQTGDPRSMLELYRAALRLRRAVPGFGDGPLRWLPAGPGVLAFARDPGVLCVVNLGATVVPLPAHQESLLTSEPLDHGLLPPDRGLAARLTPPAGSRP